MRPSPLPPLPSLFFGVALFGPSQSPAPAALLIFCFSSAAASVAAPVRRCCASSDRPRPLRLSARALTHALAAPPPSGLPIHRYYDANQAKSGKPKWMYAAASSSRQNGRFSKPPSS